MYTFLIIVLGFISLALMIIILMQSSKGGGLAGAFGGGGMNAVFGGRGAASFLSKMTTWLAGLFMVICIGLTFLKRSTVEQKSLIKQEQQQTGTAAPALPLLPAGQLTSPAPGNLPSTGDSIK